MTINTIEVAEKPISDTDTVSALEESLREIGVKNARAFSSKLYSLDGELEVDDITKLLNHDVTQDVFVNSPLKTENQWDFAIRVDYKPGVTDNAARVLKKDLGITGVEDVDAYTSDIHYIKGKFNPKLKDVLERVTSNPQIHDITILTKEEFAKKNGFENNIHPVNLGDRANVFDVGLSKMDHEELLRTGKVGTLNLDLIKDGMTEEQIAELRGGTLSLAEDYMKEILKYSKSKLNTQVKGRKKGNLTDTELEVLAQMWSEHCRHSLYNASFPGSEKGIFDTFIKEPTLKVLKDKPHLGVSIYKDNSGVFKFNDKWNVLIKNETHNSPSALDPFGGSITGIVGVNRDPAGTGVGGEVIGNFLGYFLGHLKDKRRYFKDNKLENLLLNPKQIYDGVVKGVEEGGNQMGIPILQGMIAHNDRYNGKPIIFVGSIGRAPIEIKGEPSHEKHIDVGDRLYILGGRAGKDGIHGATFSSEELSQNSPATAVQIGDAFTQRKMFEAMLELRDKGYIKFVTDLGAGGTSCATLEMAEETGGLELDLDKLLIKYEGMTATELFLNESQERMAIAVDKKHIKKIEDVLRKHETEFSDIGVFTDSGRAIVRSKGEEVVNLDMKFIHEGFPDRKLKPAGYQLSVKEQADLVMKYGAISSNSSKKLSTSEMVQKDFYGVFNAPNLGSVAPFMDKMDNTVKGPKVQHCIQGKGRISTKTSCMTVEIGSIEGLIQSYGHSERQVYIDAERMGVNSFLRSIGNNIAMGGNLEYMVATDQALWQSSDQPKYQQMLIEANKGIAKVIEGCKIPVISGKDSMYNQATVYDENGDVVKRGIFPTILMTTFSKIDNVDNLVTIDAKEEGDIVYVVGSETKDEIGGSEYLNGHSEREGVELHIGNPSLANIDEIYKTFKKINIAQKANLLQSANYIEAGGLITAVKETAMAGELGIEFALDDVHKEGMICVAGPREHMFSETEGRFLVTVKPENRAEFEEIIDTNYSRIGVVKGNKLSMTYQGEDVLSEDLSHLAKIYHRT